MEMHLGYIGVIINIHYTLLRTYLNEEKNNKQAKLNPLNRKREKASQQQTRIKKKKMFRR